MAEEEGNVKLWKEWNLARRSKFKMRECVANEMLEFQQPNIQRSLVSEIIVIKICINLVVPFLFNFSNFFEIPFHSNTRNYAKTSKKKIELFAIFWSLAIKNEIFEFMSTFAGAFLSF